MTELNRSSRPSHRLIRLSAVIGVAVAIFFAEMPLSSRAQQVPNGIQMKIAGQANPAGDGDQAATDEMFSHPDARPLETKLIQARKLLKDNRYSEAFPLIEDVTESPQDYFSRKEEGQSIRRGLKSNAKRLIGEQNLEGLKSFESIYGAKAQQLLSDALRRGDMPGVAEVTRRYFHTHAGYEATLLMSRYQLDHNEPLAAALGLQRLRETAAGAAFEPSLSVLLAACWARSGMPQRATDVLVQLKSKSPAAELRIAGKSQRLSFGGDAAALVWLTTSLGEQPPELNPEALHWAMYRGNPARNAVSAGGLPLLSERWANVPSSSIESRPADSSATQIDAINRGAVNLPVMQPLAVGNTIIMRRPKKVVGLGFDTGKMLFVDPPGSDQSDGGGTTQTRPQPGAMMNGGFDGNLVMDNPADNATYGTLSSDGKFVFAVEEGPDGAQPIDPQRQRFIVRGPGGRMPLDNPTNELAAYEIPNASGGSEGKIKWRIGGANADFEPQLAGAFFLGAPLPLANRLYVLAEIQGEIRLVVIDPKNGKLDWAQQLADVKNSNEFNGAVRRMSGASPSYADGVLICPTSAGAVVAVDLADRSLLWGVEYRKGPQPQAQMIQQRVRFGNMVNTISVRGDRWIDSTATLADGCVLLTPIDTEQLLCYSLIDGKQLWQLDRAGEYLYVGGVQDGKVVLVGKRQVQAIKIADGKPAWEHPLMLAAGTTPSGRGFLSGKHYYLPMSSAEVAQIDISSGQIVAKARSRAGIVPGNLICFKDDIISQGNGPNGESVMYAFHQLAPLRRSIAERLAANRDVTEALADQGEIELDEGKIPAAIADLRKSYASVKSDKDRARPRMLLVEALLTDLGSNFVAARGTVSEIEKLLLLERERLQFLRVLAEGFRKSGDRPEAFRTYLKLVDFKTSQSEPEKVRPELSVRRDRWLEARLDDLYTLANPEERAKFDEEILHRRDAALALGQSDSGTKKDDTADKLRHFLALFGWHPLADEARQQLFAQLTEADTLLERESLLRQLVQSSEPARRREAVARMALFLKDSGHVDQPEEAAIYYQRLREQYGDEICMAGKTGKQLADALPADSPVGQALASAVAYPLGRVRREPGGPRRQANMPPPTPLDWHGSRPDVFSTTNVTFDQQQQTIVGRDGMGKEKFRIPLHEGNQNRFGGYQAFNMTQNSIAAQGHLLLLNFGNQLLAMDALRAPGTGTRVLWQQDITDTSPAMFNNNTTPVQATIELPGGLKRTVATAGANGQPVDSLALVTAKCICIQRARDLIALEPLTGKLLWVRHNLPANAEIFGDDDVIVVVPLDGAVVTASTTGQDDGQVTLASGRVVGRPVRRVSVVAKPSEKSGGKDEPTAIVLRATDGEQLLAAPIAPSSRRWAYCGRKYVSLRWTDDSHAKVAVKLHDLWKQKDLDLGEFANGFRATLVGDDAVAMLDPGGKFVLASLADGRKIVDEQLESELDSASKLASIGAGEKGPSALQEIIVQHSSDQYVLIANRSSRSRSVGPTGAAADAMQNMEFGVPKANGRVYAFNARSGKPQWSVPAQVHRYYVLLNQGVDLPVLVFLRPGLPRVNAGTPAEMPKASVLCLDRRTGRAVMEEELTMPLNNFNNQLQCELSGDRAHRTVSLAMPTQTLTLHYTDDPIAPEPPYQAGLTGRPFRLGSPSSSDYLKATGRGPGAGAIHAFEPDDDDEVQ